MDVDGDGKLDDPEDIAKQISDLVGDGFNLGNFQGSEAQQLLKLINDTDTEFDEFIEKTVTEKNKTWADEQSALKKQAEAVPAKATEQVHNDIRSKVNSNDNKVNKLLDSMFNGTTLKAPIGAKKKDNQTRKAMMDLAKSLGIDVPNILNDAHMPHLMTNDKKQKKANAKWKKDRLTAINKLTKQLNDYASGISNSINVQSSKLLKDVGYNPNTPNPWSNF